MSTDADPRKLTTDSEDAGRRGDVVQVHASCRHTIGGEPAAGDAHASIEPDQIKQITACVHQGAIDVLGPVVIPQTVHQAKFSMGTVLG